MSVCAPIGIHHAACLNTGSESHLYYSINGAPAKQKIFFTRSCWYALLVGANRNIDINHENDLQSYETKGEDVGAHNYMWHNG